jgi:hypothetical protein
MNKINWYSLFAQACIIFIFVYFLGFLMGYFSTFLGFSIFKQVALMKILLIFFYFLFSLIITISHKVSRLHLFLLVVVADLLSNHFGISKPNYFPQQLLFNIILYFIFMYLGSYIGNKYLSKQTK